MNHRLGALLIIGTGATLFTLADSHHAETPVVAQSAVEGCPETSTPATQTGTVLQTFAADSNSGVIFDDSASSLRLQKKGGNFNAQTFVATGQPQYACPGDFDEDGWTDFVGGTSNGQQLGFFRNDTKDSQAAELIVHGGTLPWDDPSFASVPKFTQVGALAGGWFHDYGATCDGGGVMGCGDFNNDGHTDFVYVLESGNNGGRPCLADMFLGKGDGTFEAPYQLTETSNASALDDLRDIRFDGNLEVADYNGDGLLDFLFGAEERFAADRGFVQVFLNDNGAGHTSDSSRPTFAAGPVLVDNIDIGANGVNGIAYSDLTGDGVKDVAVAGTSSANIFIYPGIASGGVDVAGALTVNNTQVGGQILVATDFSLNGRDDLIMATNDNGGTVLYWENSGLANPFSHTRDQQITESFSDFDTGFLFDYDNDPDATMDFMFADGNGAGYATFANRVVTDFVDCGEIESGVLDLGALSGQEMVVTAARLDPTMTLPSGTTATFFMSNENPENWIEATPCVDDANDFCASFPKPVGQTVKWKAELCSNAAHTLSPSISGMNVSFDYTQSEEHYRSGVVVDDGVAYVGAFKQPGNSGHFYALAAGLNETYWDFADQLNAMADSDRAMYTSNASGTSRLDFSVANASTNALQTTLGVASTAQATDVINWQRSARFGVGGVSRLGSVESSTAAVVVAPRLPNFYPRADTDTKTLVDTFISDHSDRPTIVLVGSRDGALHAVRSTPTDITGPNNGNEAWAYVPGKIANSMVADFANGTATAYPDGSPTVADVILDDGAVHTVAVVSGGNGHKGVFALDITETIDEVDGSILGPTPLWHVVPGGSLAGQALSKPVVSRVNVGGVAKFYAIMATGIAADNPVAPFTKGRDVVAVDMTTGAIVWQFQAKCPVTSDIVAFETDDDLESGTPTFDGFIDRAVFADNCGYVYKVDPAQNVGSSYITGLGTISTGHTDPDANAVNAIFSTTDTACAIGAERPIVGTIGARTDLSGRFTLFFGTGGIESFDPSLNNAFYAVHADNGEIRGCAEGTPEAGRIEGTCTAGVCVKFYGGVVVTSTNVIVTRATDPPVGTGTCEFGTSEVTGFSITNFDVDFSVATTGATVSSLFADAGALYFATIGGDVVKIGTPRAASAGGDSTSGAGGGQATADDGSGTGGEGMDVIGWRALQ